MMKGFRVAWLKVSIICLIGIVGISGSMRADVVTARAPDQQDDQEDLGHIISYQTEIIFPAAVRFGVSVDVAQDAIQNAILTVYQSGETFPPVIVNPDQQSGVSTEELTQLSYMWSLNSGTNRLRPFTPVSFRWEVVTNDGLTSMAADDLRLEDNAHGKWQVAGPPPLVFYSVDNNLAGVPFRRDLLPVLALLEQHTSQTLDFRFVVLEADKPLCQEAPGENEGDPVRLIVTSRQDGTEFPCSEAAFEAIYDDAGMTVVKNVLGYAPFQDVIVQRMVTEAYDPVWRDTFVPEWFKAGLGLLYRLRADQGMLVLAQSAERQDSLFTIADLSVPLPDSASYQEQELWQAQNYLLVYYLVDQYGPDVVFDLARTAGGGDFEGALFTLVGGDELVLYENWTGWLQFVDADNLIWTPYQ